jgi:LPXTG-motif cell wall-anchored protein
MILANPASAHLPTANAVCVGTDAVLTIDLENYATAAGPGVTVGKNSITVTEDGKPVVPSVDNPDFGKVFKATVTDKHATATHTFVVTVLAWDDKPGPDGNGKQGFTFVKTLPTLVCEEAKTTTTVPPTTTTAPATTTSSAPVVAPTTTTPAAPAPLANTGVSAGVPLAIAGVLVVLGAGLLVFLRMSSRRRRSEH